MHIQNITNRIASFNDEFRRRGQGQGRVEISDQIRAQGTCFAIQAKQAVEAFNDFNGNNDPYHRHDFGIVDVCGWQVVWKIDYFDRDLWQLAPNPADLWRTYRVLSISFPQVN